MGPGEGWKGGAGAEWGIGGLRGRVLQRCISIVITIVVVIVVAMAVSVILVRVNVIVEVIGR